MAIAAATLLAAELPSPDPTGMDLCSTISIPKVGLLSESRRLATKLATFLPASIGTSRLGDTTEKRRPDSRILRAVIVSPGQSIATPRMSNPGPRFETVAGAYALTDRGVILFGNHQSSVWVLGQVMQEL